MTRRPGAPLRLAVPMAAALLLAACGIPADDDPRAISPDQRPDTSRPPTDVRADDDTAAVDLWFTRQDEAQDRNVLVSVESSVPVGSETGEPTPRVVLDTLLEGVPDEYRNSVASWIPTDTTQADQPDLNDGVLTVNLDDGINNVEGEGALLAYGQMVCTVDELPGVDAVEFTIDGDPVEPSSGEGPARRRLTCADYDGRKR